MRRFQLISLSILSLFCTCCAASNHAVAQQQPAYFRAYQADFSGKTAPKINLQGIPDASQGSVAPGNGGVTVTLSNKGLWRGFWPVGLLGTWAGYAPLFGQERVHVEYSLSVPQALPGGNRTGFAVQYYGGQTVELGGAGAIQADGRAHDLVFELPASAAGHYITALWVRLDNPGGGKLTLTLRRFWWERRLIDNRLDADTLLKTPPALSATIADDGGVPAIYVDNVPTTAMGWTSSVLQNVNDAELRDVVSQTDFPLDRVIMTLGEQIPLELYPPSWLGPDQYDFSYVDTQANRILQARPDTRLIVQVALDGATWWTWLHPDLQAAGQLAGIPDYLSDVWQRDSREAIRQLVAHVLSQGYGKDVIGYELMNGPTEDCTFPIDDTSQRAADQFRAYLRAKYGSDTALRVAWHDRRASLDTATPALTPPEWQRALGGGSVGPLLLEPDSAQKLVDQIAFHNTEYQQVILNFAQAVKEATQRRALVGARVGDFMGSLWTWPEPLALQQYPIDELLQSKDFDFFEVQEPYIGRGLADTGTGVPIVPPAGLAAHNKLVIVQNDVRTFLSLPTAGYGRTPDLPTTIDMQRRIFVNALVQGTYPYLWQQDYHYNTPALLDEYKKEQAIFQRGQRADRHTDAEIAFVFDVDYRKDFGYDPIKSSPSRGLSLFDYPKFTWARAGMPFDMIFLQDLAAARPYKVYVFMHTVGLTPDQRTMIEKVVRQQGRTAIFVWADGLMQNGKVDPGAMSDLVGMDLQMSSREANWQMTPQAALQHLAGVAPDQTVGTLAINEGSEPTAPDNIFAPSFAVIGSGFQALADRKDGGGVGMALHQENGWNSIYSNSPILSTELLRWAASLSGAHVYADTDDACYIDHSFIGFHARADRTVHVTLPEAQPLYNVFTGDEQPASVAHDIPVKRNETYLFFRGSKADWDALSR